MKQGLLLAVIALCACGGDDADAFSDHDIEGVVMDEFTDKGIAGAKVTFVSDTLEKSEALSEKDGRFVLHVEVPSGVRFGTIAASRSGYADSAQQSVYFDGTALRAELRLRPSK